MIDDDIPPITVINGRCTLHDEPYTAVRPCPECVAAISAPKVTAVLKPIVDEEPKL